MRNVNEFHISKSRIFKLVFIFCVLPALLGGGGLYFTAGGYALSVFAVTVFFIFVFTLYIVFSGNRVFFDHEAIFKNNKLLWEDVVQVEYYGLPRSPLLDYITIKTESQSLSFSRFFFEDWFFVLSCLNENIGWLSISDGRKGVYSNINTD